MESSRSFCVGRERSHSSPEWLELSRKQGKRVELNEVECVLCLKLMYKPTTTTCGHSFCSGCLKKSLEQCRPKCPICRSCIHSQPNRLAVATDLNNIVQRMFPEEYREREREELEEEHELIVAKAKDTAATLPCFVLCPILPRQRLQLHIFEPRYRLMTQRCLEGSRRFGMVPRDSLGRNMDCGTEVEIVESESLPGGRFYLEVIGLRVFHITETWTTDGYLTGKVRFVEPTDYSSVALSMSRNLERLCDSFQQLVSRRGFERNTELSLRFYRDLGSIPPANSPGERAIWVAALINPMRPLPQVAPDVRVPMLQAKTVMERLNIVTEALSVSMERLNPTWNNHLSRAIFLNVKRLFRFVFKYSWLFALGWYSCKQSQSIPPPPPRGESVV